MHFHGEIAGGNGGMADKRALTPANNGGDGVIDSITDTNTNAVWSREPKLELRIRGIVR
jgi:hypothetical protein